MAGRYGIPNSWATSSGKVQDGYLAKELEGSWFDDGNELRPLRFFLFLIEIEVNNTKDNMYGQKIKNLGIFEGFSGGDLNDSTVSNDPPIPLTNDEIVAIEQSLGVFLPADYVEFLTSIGGGGFIGAYAGARPIQNRKGHIHEIIDKFYGSKNERLYRLADEIMLFKDRIPAELMPIGENAFGDQFCLGIKGQERGKVYIWDHEDGRTEQDYLDIYGAKKAVPREWRFGNISLVAESFSEFFSKLEKTGE